MTDAVTLREPPIPGSADLRQIPMPVDVEAVLALAKNSPPEAFKAMMLLWGAAWHQVPPGSLPHDDVELCAMAGLALDDAWAPLRAQALSGFTLHSDGRLYHPGIVAKALAALAEMEKVEKRKADDRRRQKLHYDRKTGKVPKLDAETSRDSGDRHDDETNSAPAPSPPPNGIAPSPSNGHSTSHVDEVRAEEPHANGQAAPTTLAAPQPIIKVNAEPKLTIAQWDAEVQKYRVHGTWSWRSLGPSPRFPECKAPSFILAKHGYGG